MINLDRVIDNKVCRNHRIDQGRILPAACHGRPHGGKVHNGGDTGEVLQDNPCGHERDGGVVGGGRRPGGKAFDVLKRSRAAIAVSQEIFQEDPDGVGQPVQNTKPGVLQ